MSNFKHNVLNIVRSIPKGSVMSYSEVAKLTGKVNSHRAVAQIMSQNFNPEIPCQRGICANGNIGGYNRGGKKIKDK